MTTAIEPVPAAETAPETPETPTPQPEATTPETQTPETKPFDPNTIPHEVRDYFQRQYAEHEKYKSAAQEWEQVRSDPRFSQWQQSLNAPQKPPEFNIDEAQFAAVLSGDKNAFAQIVQNAAKHMLETQIAPQLQQTQQQVQFQQKISELQQTVAKFPDFKELDKRGLIEPIIRKYPNLSFEDAYYLAKKDTLDEEADRRARGIVATKKNATVAKPAVPPGARTPKVSAKNREEAMEMVMEAARAGRPIPEFDEIGD